MNRTRLFVLFGVLAFASASSACSGSTSSVGSSSSGGKSGSSSGSTSGGSSSSSGGGEGDALFAAPAGDATPGSLFGVWGGALEDGGVTFDTRWRLREAQITIAARCALADGRESETASVTAAARVSSAEIAILETKKDEKRAGDFLCRATAQPRNLAACDVPEGFERECFRLEGTTLTLFGESLLDELKLTKLSD